MSRGRQSMAMMLMLVMAAIFVCGILSQSENGGSEIQGFQPQQQALSGETWRLDRFENQAYELEGRLWDKGWFTNTLTGEQVEARCINPEAGDPALGDLFTRSGNQLIPVSGGPQTFEVFEVIPTSTPIPTVTQLPTAITFPTFTPLAGQPVQPEIQEEPTRLNFLQVVGLSICGLLLLVILFFVFGAWLQSHKYT